MHKGQFFENINFTSTPFDKDRYEECTFVNCDFSNQFIEDYKFEDCTFISCDLNNTRLTNSSLQNITFKECKLMGIKFEDCSSFLFSIHCSKCRLDLSSFYGTKLTFCTFDTCEMNEVDFTEANGEGLSFDNCNLKRSTFYNSKLNKCDFQTAENFSISPKFNDLKGATFSRDSIEGLLTSFQIKIK